MVNSSGATMAGVGTEPKAPSGTCVTSTMKVMPPPGQIQTGAPPQVRRVARAWTARVSRTGLAVTPARSEPPAPAAKSTEASAGSQFSAMRAMVAASRSGRSRRRGTRSASSS